MPCAVPCSAVCCAVPSPSCSAHSLPPCPIPRPLVPSSPSLTCVAYFSGPASHLFSRLQACSGPAQPATVAEGWNTGLSFLYAPVLSSAATWLSGLLSYLHRLPAVPPKETRARPYSPFLHSNLDQRQGQLSLPEDLLSWPLLLWNSLYCDKTNICCGHESAIWAELKGTVHPGLIRAQLRHIT